MPSSRSRFSSFTISPSRFDHRNQFPALDLLRRKHTAKEFQRGEIFGCCNGRSGDWSTPFEIQNVDGVHRNFDEREWGAPWLQCSHCRSGQARMHSPGKSKFTWPLDNY
jgi:hypothetical protein